MAFFRHRLLGIGIGVVYLSYTGAAPGAEAKRAKVSFADVGKLSCGELKELAPDSRRMFHSIWLLRKKTHDLTFADRGQLKKLNEALEWDTLALAKDCFAKIKALYDVGTAVVAAGDASKKVLDQALKIEAAIEAAGTVTAKMKALKGLVALGEQLAFVANPYLILAMFAIDTGIQVVDAVADSLNRAKNSEQWIDEAGKLQSRLVFKQTQAANFSASLLVEQEKKKCPQSKETAAKCFGTACGGGVVGKADYSDSKNRWYDLPYFGLGYYHVCREFDTWGFWTRVRKSCRTEYENLVAETGYEDDPKGYPQFALARKVIENNATRIKERCARETCNTCAARLAEEYPAKQQKAELEKRLKYCRSTFAIDRPVRLGGRNPLHGPPVDYTDHTGRWPIRDNDARFAPKAVDWAALRKKEAQEAADKRDRALAADPSALAIPPPLKVPRGVKVFCECVATCREGSSLGYPSYRFSDNPMVVSSCQEGPKRFAMLLDIKFCPKQDDMQPVACQWRRSDEPLAMMRKPGEKRGTLAKCEWYFRGTKPEPIPKDSIISTGDSVEKGFDNRVFRTLAACRAKGVSVSFCYRTGRAEIVEGWGAGFRLECLNTEGNVEVRAMDYHDYEKFSKPDPIARGDRDENNPFKLPMPGAAAKPKPPH